MSKDQGTGRLWTVRDGDLGETARVTPDMNADRAELVHAHDRGRRPHRSASRRSPSDYSSGVRDDVLAALDDAERALVQASRRLTIALRALAS